MKTVVTEHFHMSRFAKSETFFNLLFTCTRHASLFVSLMDFFLTEKDYK